MNDISEESYQKLKKILEKENHRTYTMEEVREIGNDLIEFYEVLVDGEDEYESLSLLQ